MEVKQKLVNESKNHRVQYILRIIFNCKIYDLIVLLCCYTCQLKCYVLVTSLKETEIYGLEKKLEVQANNLRLQFNEELNRLKNESDEDKMKLIISHDQKIVELQQTNKLEMSQMQKSATEKQIELTQRVLVLENERDLLKSERDALKEENQRLIEDKKLQVIYCFVQN